MDLRTAFACSLPTYPHIVVVARRNLHYHPATSHSSPHWETHPKPDELAPGTHLRLVHRESPPSLPRTIAALNRTMAGRRRRTSDSTTGTVEPDRRAYAKELSILKRYDPVEGDMLQTFVLEDAIVCDKKGNPVELFTVNTQGPFTVRGRVVIDGPQTARAVKPSTKSALIETHECTRYAIGVSDNGYGAWAGGAAGWYEIRPPSAAYKAIFDHTIEGVSIYYTILDIIEEHAAANTNKKGPKKKGVAMTIGTLLFKYAVAMGDGATLEEVEQRCDDHASFLISHFYEEPEFEWTPTLFFKWMTERHSDIHKKVLELRKKKLAGVKPGPSIPEKTEAVVTPTVSDEPSAQKALSKRKQRGTPADDSQTDSHDFAVSARDMRSRSRGKTKTQSPPAPEPLEEAMAVDETPEVPNQTELVRTVHDRSNVDALLEAIDDIKPEAEPLSKAAFSKVSSKLYYKYKVKAYLGAADILKYYAKELVERLDQDEWRGSGFWKTLEESAQGPRFSLEHIQLEQIPEALTRRKAKEVSNPRNRWPSLPEEARGSTDVATPPPRRVGRPAGKMSGLRLAGTSGKRRFDSGDETPESVSRQVAKRFHAGDASDEDEVMNDGSSSEDDDSSVDSAESPTALKVVVRAENIPTTIPKGPNGTWVCDEDDCGFVERNPESEDGRIRINEHMQNEHYHEDENQVQRINLAVTEGDKNHLPIDHLLEKIRQMGHKIQATEELEINETVVPQPIKRRLLT
ncbi:hypothetical protein CTAM01_05326 [Colletotrichum tamarilloi]|uniref:RFTS domain-containing protein n=1 Tax=Colletotrichum tamarilloi TaxID=1209934 RepID=A0ABQ9RFZ3_9PEZI|nr:uncharacterized protein CTAM01_05326 [Colletotrichum tamarilloi]KAK1502513.1 hypothetical protein CTAM01_05326 [Colletotrichum tamarilloi]